MSVGGDDTFTRASEPVGAVLRRRRRELGLTGGEVGQRASLSQSTISRIENGRYSDRDAVVRIARALEFDEVTVHRLAEHAESADNTMTEFRREDAALAGGQHGFGQLEAAATLIQVFGPAVVPGLLQTSEYARSLLSSFQRLLASDGTEPPAVAVSEAVAARVGRQEILVDTSKTFEFVMTESVLVDRVCPPAGMVEQLSRIREVARAMDNVSVRIIPAGSQLALPPLTGFVLLDKRVVAVDQFNMALITKAAADARLYSHVFDIFDASADGDVDSILDRHMKTYAESLLSDSRG